MVKIGRSQSYDAVPPYPDIAYISGFDDTTSENKFSKEDLVGYHDYYCGEEKSKEYIRKFGEHIGFWSTRNERVSGFYVCHAEKQAIKSCAILSGSWTDSHGGDICGGKRIGEEKWQRVPVLLHSKPMCSWDPRDGEDPGTCEGFWEAAKAKLPGLRISTKLCPTIE
ncbi:hypothetical protein TWF694_001447 [Orbilia ellipsospora]|uniref:Uncharacterized protein n=1 Tax=Orbilia ellipsospora TaxID=2528407 RepID=A0AAV9XRQ4_9PEZI